MATVAVPISPVIPDESFEIELDGVVYTFRFRYNNRTRAYYIDLQEPGGEYICQGRKLTQGGAPIEYCRVDSSLQGVLWADVADGGDAHGYDMGTIRLFYTNVAGLQEQALLLEETLPTVTILS